MRIRSGSFSIISIFLLAICSIAGFSNRAASQEFQDCDILLTKSAPGAGDTEFEFNGRDENGDTFSFFLADDGGHAGFGVEVGTFTEITEPPQFGFRFGGIECETSPGVTVTQNSANSFVIDCQVLDATADCQVTNVPTPNIPTLSEWGMIVMAGALGMIGLYMASRRRKAAA